MHDKIVHADREWVFKISTGIEKGVINDNGSIDSHLKVFSLHTDFYPWCKLILFELYYDDRTIR